MQQSGEFLISPLCVSSSESAHNGTQFDVEEENSSQDEHQLHRNAGPMPPYDAVENYLDPECHSSGLTGWEGRAWYVSG